MKEKRNKKKHEKRMKKHKRSRSSSDSESGVEKVEWIEASSSHSRKLKSKKKRKRRTSSDSDLGESKVQWVEASSSKSTKKKHRDKSESSSSSESESSSSNKYEKQESFPNSAAEGRDSWMTENSFVPTLSKEEMRLSSRQRRAESTKEHREKEEKIQRERELNPHWKNDGAGLPEKETAVEDLNLPSTSVGDGGYSWLKKAYYRIQEQAQQEGRSMEDIAVDRWGSLDKLVSMIKEAEERMKSLPDWKDPRNQYKDKYHSHDRQRRDQFRKPSSSYESEQCFDAKFQFRKPSSESKSRKVLNKFKSSRRPYPDDCSKYDDFNSHEISQTQHLEHEREVLNIKKRNSDSHIPAWKKVTSSSEKLSDSKMNSHDGQTLKKQTEEPEKVKEMDLPIIYSADDLNHLGARQMKAELMGDTALAEKLQKQFEEAKRMVEERGFATQPSKKVEEVVLSKFDSQGQARPLMNSKLTVSDYKQKKSNKKYFDDGSSHSLKQMFEREKLTTADDQLEMFVEASSRSNETAEFDSETGHISQKLSKVLSSTRAEEKDIGKAIQQHQKKTAALDKCSYCLDQPQMKKHLIVDVGEQLYLCLPGYQTLTEGHCLIVPKNHVSSFLLLDENEWSEVNDFKYKLRKLFKSDKKSVIFIETSMNFKYFPHAVLECIPVPEEDGDMAPFYFKKAIQESESEWANNIKLVDLTKKDLRHSIPKNLPYFHVEFDPKVHSGFAHVIEDEKYFPKNFGKETLGGILDIDYNNLYKNKKEDPLKKCKEVVDFQKRWKTL